MNPIAQAFVALNVIALLALPRRWAALPLLIGACYMTRGQGIEFGPITLWVIRILIVAALVRVTARLEWRGFHVNRLDIAMLCWGAWMVASVGFHSAPSEQVLLRFRHVFDGWGIYFTFRVLYRDPEEAWHLARVCAIALIPIAAAMVVEQATGRNPFATFGGVPEMAFVREGIVRAQGPFGHPILAGTVGAVSLPLVIGLWRQARLTALLGSLACVAMVAASGSSGPVVSATAGLAVLLFWRGRYQLRWVRWLGVAAYLALELVMERPAYYIIQRLDVTGSSTGWHRARLIESAFDHLNEWWLAGTDYTRHWMATGVSWSTEHTDITNHYLQMGVLGGLPLMLLFIVMMLSGFWYIGAAIRREQHDGRRAFLAWATGGTLFAHAATCLSVSYFDQSVVFLYMALASASAWGRVMTEAEAVPAAAPLPPAPPRWERPHPSDSEKPEWNVRGRATPTFKWER